MKKQSGFTLIELMIVVAIVAILAAIALPAYQSYTKKARFTEVVSAVGPYKTAIEVCVQTQGVTDLTGTTCTTNSADGIPAEYTNATGNVASVKVSSKSGIITATGNTTTFGGAYTYILVPSLDSAGKITWSDSTGTCKTNALC